LGFLSSLLITVWLPFISLGTLAITVYSIYFGLGPLGLVVFVGANVGIAVFWNKARKRGRADAFDDRLSFEKMERAREWWIAKNKEKDS